MDQRQIDSLIDERLPTLRIISMAFVGSVLFYVGLCWLLLPTLGPEPIMDLPFPVIAGIAASQLVVILAGYLLSRSIRAGAASVATAAATDPGRRPGIYMQRYVQSVVVALAMRELAAVVGLMLSLLTGQIMWVVFLGGASVISMLVHWPRRGAVEEWFSQQGLIS